MKTLVGKWESFLNGEAWGACPERLRRHKFGMRPGGSIEYRNPGVCTTRYLKGNEQALWESEKPETGKTPRDNEYIRRGVLPTLMQAQPIPPRSRRKDYLGPRRKERET